MSSWKRIVLVSAGFGAGLVLMAAAVLAGVAWYTSSPTPPAPCAYISFQATPSDEVKAFEAEWERLKKTNSGDFENLRGKFIVSAQMLLGEFGYGTTFTGVLDKKTKEALSEYQAHNCLPVTGDIEPRTIDQLMTDKNALDPRAKPVLDEARKTALRRILRLSARAWALLIN